MIRSIDELKVFFEAGDKPSEENFSDLIESNFVGNYKMSLISSSNTIIPDRTFILIESTGGAVVVGNDPQIADGKPFQMLCLMGRNDNNYVTLENGRGLSLNGDCKLGGNAAIILAYIVDTWVELSRRYPLYTELSGKLKTDFADPDFTYLDAKLGWSFVTLDHKIYLFGDSENPGEQKYYGTNINGMKGYHEFPQTNGLIRIAPSDNNMGFLSMKTADSIEVDTTMLKLHLVNDSTMPGPYRYYGTDSLGAKGWLNLDFTDRWVKANATDPSAGYLDAKIKNSIEVDHFKLQLVGDLESPGGNHFYGTSPTGDKGWYLAVTTDENIKTDPLDTTAGLLIDKVDHSLRIDIDTHKLILVGDIEIPGANKFYGTDEDGNRGWFIPDRVRTSETDPDSGFLTEKIKGSIVVDSEQLQLAGDNVNPGANYYYGTNAQGDKGWIEAVTTDERVKASSGDLTTGYLDAKVANSIEVNTDNKLALVGDTATPAADSFYGTDENGTLGFYYVLQNRVKKSVELDDRQLQLVGDNNAPGSDKYYGTDSMGTKGFHDLPATTLDPIVAALIFG